MIRFVGNFELSSEIELVSGQYTVLYVTENGVLSASEGANVLILDSGMKAIVKGQLLGESNIKSFEISYTDIKIEQSAYLYSIFTSIELVGANQSVKCFGKIETDQYSGIAIRNEEFSGTTTILNKGEIHAGVVGAGIYFANMENGEITNYGTVSGGNSSFNSVLSTGNMNIKNYGWFQDAVLLGAGNDTYNGKSGRMDGQVSGGGGNDKLMCGVGNNVILGGVGSDTLYGGLGADKLTGGDGSDVFLFSSVKESTTSSAGRDTITGFKRGADDIDLTAIDVNSKVSGVQNFDFIGAKAFTKHVAELRYDIVGNETYLYGDVNGDGKADFSIHPMARSS